MNKDQANERKLKKAFLKTSALIGAAAAASSLFPLAAVAQTTQPAPAPAADEEETSEEEAVVVTGSRIRTEFNSPSPLQVITTESAVLSGINDAAEMIQGSSLAAGSPQNDATLSSAFVTEGGPGSQTVSLRGLGANRTLVLLNGRRAGPAGTRGQVSAFDLNVLPLSVVARTEILKDGASSIYGSDAIAGVINILTRRDMEGGAANVYYSHPQEDGGSNVAADVSWGTTWDRGYFNASVDYSNQEQTLQGQRDYTNCGESYITDAATGARADIMDPRTNTPSCRGNVLAGQVWMYDYSDDGIWADSTLPFTDPAHPCFAQRQYCGIQTSGAVLAQYDPTGTLGTYAPGAIFPAGTFGPNAPANWFLVNTNSSTQGLTNFNGPAEQQASVVPEITRSTLFLEGGVDLGGNVEAYAEVLFNRRESATQGARQVWTYLYSYTLGDSLNPGWVGFFGLSPTPVVDHFSASQEVNYTRIVTGLRGEFAGPLGPVNWDIYLQSSVSDADYSQDVILDDAVRSAQFRSDFGPGFGNSIPRPTASCVGYFTPISNRPCVDVNWMSGDLMNGAGFTPQEEAFLYDRETGNTSYSQQFIEASFSTDLFELPAGNVGAAFGIVHRRDKLTDTPGAVTLAGNSWGLSSAGITTGSDRTTEIFGEVLIPLIRDGAFADRLDVSLSGRHTDVDSYGTNDTYKAGVNWQITPEYRIRATHGTSFRAPALFELYLAAQTSFARQAVIDPCINIAINLGLGAITQEIYDNCVADGIPTNWNGAGSSALIVSSGGAGLLEAETSTATTLGFVWTPRFANLSVAVDWYDIEIEDEVTQLTPGQIMFGCYTSDNFAIEPLCNLFTRGQTASPYLVNTVFASYINVASQQNSGVDLTVNYSRNTPLGDFRFATQISYQLEDIVQLFAGIPDDDRNGRNGDPEWVGNFDFQLDRGDWTYFWRTNFIGPASDDEITPNQFNIQGPGPDYLPRLVTAEISTDFVAYHSFSVRREFDNWSILGGVSNLFDTEPPRVTTLGAAAQNTLGPSILASQYDYIGRRAFVRLSRSF